MEPEGLLSNLKRFLEQSTVGQHFLADREAQMLAKRKELLVERARLLKDTKATELARAEEPKFLEAVERAADLLRLAREAYERSKLTAMAAAWNRDSQLMRVENQLRSLAPPALLDFIRWTIRWQNECHAAPVRSSVEGLFREQHTYFQSRGGSYQPKVIISTSAPAIERVMAVRREAEALLFEALSADELDARLRKLRARVDEPTPAAA